jgi:hypothetical protein
MTEPAVPWGTPEESLRPPFVEGLHEPHVSVGSPFQDNYLDATSGADLGPYKKHQGGPVDFATGHQTGEGFADGPIYRQV